MTPSLTFQVIYLPDYDRGYVLQRHGGLGTVDASATLANGWQLTSLAQKTDSQVPQTIEAIGKLIPTLLVAPLGKRGGAAAPITPGLYKINFVKDTAPFLTRVLEK